MYTCYFKVSDIINVRYFVCYYMRKALLPVLILDRGSDYGLQCIVPGGCSHVPAEKLSEEASSSLHSIQHFSSAK